MEEVRAIWYQFRNDIRSHVRTRVANDAEADVIVQEVFVKIIKGIDRIKAARNVRQYLYKLTRNTLVDSFRARKMRFSEIGERDFEQESDPAPKAMQVEAAARCVESFIEKLPEKYREVLVLVELQNMPQTEVAKLLGLSYSGTKSRVQRGREMLRAELLACCYFEFDAYGNLLCHEDKNCGC